MSAPINTMKEAHSLMAEVEYASRIATSTWKSGYDAGREIGFNEGLQAAQELIGGKDPQQIIMERRAKLKSEA